MMTLWGGRFSGKLDQLAWELNASISVDKAMAEEDVDGSLAWAEGLRMAGVIEEVEFKSISNGLTTIKHEINQNSFGYSPADEDIHSAIERRLTDLIGLTARKLHTGRSRNDQVATDFRLWMVRRIPLLIDDLNNFQKVLINKAEESGDSIMPGYTHLQRAQPILTAHWWMSHFWPLERDKQRLLSLFERVSVLPLGSGALAGNPTGVDREFLAKKLGFSHISQNSLDAVSDRDFTAEFLFCAALIGTHLSKLAEQMVIFTSTEFGFFTLPDEFSTGSSLMPQKKNPDLFELTRGKAGTILGSLVGFLTTLKGLPSTYDKDLQEDKSPVFNVFSSITLILPVLGSAIQSTAQNKNKMESSIDSFMMATDLADYLTEKGVPFRDAHESTGKVVNIASKMGLELGQLSIEDFQSIDPHFGQDLFNWLSPHGSINRKNSIGGTSPSAVKNQITKAKLLINGEKENG
ncbi:MAG TPA: argininosuccinate lyase [Anaerolineales bacterium]|nr:argininosuccinate lyase [Anaerolineales bacterium]